VADVDVISTFWDGMTCHTLVHELGCEQPKTTKELLDIITWHTFGEEAVRAAFILGNAKAVISGGWATPSKATTKGVKKGTKGGKKGQKRRPGASPLRPAIDVSYAAPQAHEIFQCSTSPGVFSRYHIYIFLREEGSLSCLRLTLRATPMSTTRLYRCYVNWG
jgi:hypothetical protein